MNPISSRSSFSKHTLSQEDEQCAAEFLEQTISLEEIGEELDGRTVVAALRTAGIRLKGHFAELNLISDGQIDVEALKKRLMIRHSWSTSVLIGS